MEHIPIMVKECLELLDAKKDKTIVDCTLGLGGHTKAITETGAEVISLDRDSKAIEFAKKNLPEKAVVVNSEFSKLREVLDKLSIRKVDGILADLGVSTYQLESDERGFGFEGKLDMRMNPEQELSAYKIVNEYTEEKLSRLLFDYGEKKFARSIARAICNSRRLKNIETGEELLETIKKVMPPKYRFSREHHWATPTFRALRMEVNNDLNELKSLIAAAPECLNPKGRLVVISFHSMEDRIVKHTFKEMAKKKIVKLLTKKPLTASEQEIKSNPKALRAKVRAFELP